MRRLALLVVLLLAAALGAGASSAGTQRPLVVALNLPSPGFQVGAVIGTRVVFARGYEVDLAKEIARKLGRKVELVNVPRFASLYEAGPKPWDVALAEVTINPERDANVDFSVPYLTADQGVLARKELVPTPTSIAGLRGLRLCTLRGSTSATLVSTTIAPTRKPALLTTMELLLDRVRTGACDAAVADMPILATLRAEVPDRYGPIVGRIATGEAYGVVLPEGSTLKPAVDDAIERLRRNGVLDRLAKRWLALDVTDVPVLR